MAVEGLTLSDCVEPLAQYENRRHDILDVLCM